MIAADVGRMIVAVIVVVFVLYMLVVAFGTGRWR